MSQDEKDCLFDIIESCAGETEEVKLEKDKIFAKFPFAKGIDQKSLNPKNLSLVDLEEVITTAAYMNVNSDEYVDEFLWKLDGRQFRTYFEPESLNELNNTSQKWRLKPKAEFQNRVLYDELNRRFPGLFFPEKAHAKDVWGYSVYRCVAVGNLRLLKYWVATLAITLHSDLCPIAAAAGHLEILKFLHERVPMYSNTCTAAAGSGHLHCLKFLRERRYPCEWTDEATAAAASRGHLDCLKYMREHGCRWTEAVILNAIDRGHVECLRYAIEQKCQPSLRAYTEAALFNKPDCMKVLFEYKVPCNEQTTACEHAALSGSLECLRMMHEHKFAWDAWTCIRAAANGHLDCLQYAHTHGCVWNKKVCETAAANGHLDCLQYAHENGCEWDAETYKTAKFGGRLNCLEYLITHGCPEN